MPAPQVSEPTALDSSRMQMPPGNPLLLSLTLQELLARDAVQVELIPEKKGLLLEHVEYEVSSQVPAGAGGGGGVKGRARCACLALCGAPAQPPAPPRGSTYSRFRGCGTLHLRTLTRAVGMWTETPDGPVWAVP